MRLLYNIAIGTYAWGVRFAAPFNSKASQMVKGWRNWRQEIPFEKLNGDKVAWFHAASLGEFEQARPVLEKFRKEYPDYKICLTFFSSSGYEVRKNYSQTDVVCYLPPDTRRNATDFVNRIKPDVAFFVKYEFWYNYLNTLKKRGTPTYLFSAIFRPSQYFFKWYGGWFAKQLQCYRYIFVQNEESLQLLNSVGMTRCTITGDTRFDRVNDIAKEAQQFPKIETFLYGTSQINASSSTPTLVAGSTWEPDEANIKLFLSNYDKPLKVILAPHVIDESHLQQIEKLFGKENCMRYSQLPEGNARQEQSILIIDNIGMLSSLYRYATFAYIGGGFGKGIHNILEAAIFGIPVCFGPNHKKFQEAVEMLKCGGARTFSTPDKLKEIMEQWLDNVESYNKSCEASKKYMQANLGATQCIIDKIETK